VIQGVLVAFLVVTLNLAPITQPVTVYPLELRKLFKATVFLDGGVLNGAGMGPGRAVTMHATFSDSKSKGKVRAYLRLPPRR